MAIQNLRLWKREMNALKKLPEVVWRNRSAQLIRFTIRRLVKLTNDQRAVKSGSYRISHTVEQGGYIVFEFPGRPDPGIKVRTLGQFGNPPDSGIAKQARSNLDFGNYEFVNPMPYASQVEVRHQIYVRAADFARSKARELADRPLSDRERKEIGR